MVCSNCGTENRAGRKFCSECAAPLAIPCPSCGALNEPGEKFCGECAQPLPAGRPTTTPAGACHASSPVSERRLVSVLFADLVGFTTLAEGKDAEDTRELLSAYFDLSRDVIGRYGGTVEKFIGDAVMAVWGAPTAYEDDAERAVRAALDLVEAVRTLGPTIQARAGVLTGEAAVTLGATNQGMVAGDIVNTASRLQSAAAPGTVLVGEATHRAAAARSPSRRPGSRRSRARRLPCRHGAHSVSSPSSAGATDPRRWRPRSSAATTSCACSRTSSTRPGANAGPGSSRSSARPASARAGLAGSSRNTPTASSTPPPGMSAEARRTAKDQFLGARRDGPATSRAVRDRRRDDHPPKDRRDARQVRSRRGRPTLDRTALLTLLGVESSTGRFGAAVRRVADVLRADRGPGHRHDGLRGLPLRRFGLDRLRRPPARVEPGRPDLVITLSRPELLERRPDWGAAKRNFTSLYLEPLDPRAMRELLAGLVPGLPAAAVVGIVARADGIPLYAVETVRMLVAEGRLTIVDGTYRPVGDLTSLAVPETLTALIASRLDSLAPDDRTLVSGRCRPRPEFHAGGPRGRFRDRCGRAGAAIARARPPRAADPRDRPAKPGARPIRLRPGIDPRGRLQHACQARPQAAPSCRRAFLREPGDRRDCGRPRRPLSGRARERCRGTRSRRARRSGQDRPRGGGGAGRGARRERPGTPLLRTGPRW